jgi:hypothetical protein
MNQAAGIKKLKNIFYSVIPAEAGIQTCPCESREPEELDSRFHGKPWIPHQVRNDGNKATL